MVFRIILQACSAFLIRHLWGDPTNPKPAKGNQGQPKWGEPESSLRHLLSEKEEGGCMLPLPFHKLMFSRASLVDSTPQTRRKAQGRRYGREDEGTSK